MTTIRNLLSLSVLALTGYLVLVLAGHLWDRHSQETQALGFSGVFERYLASSAGFPDDPNTYRAATEADGGQQVPGRQSATREE
jgi:hypothetical protein